MCEYIPWDATSDRHVTIGLNDDGTPIDPGLVIRELKPQEGHYFECWHPSTQSWEAMLPPTEGLGITMEPGSRLRARVGEPPRHTKNRPPVEGNMREQLGG